jgi:hypothetical protein
MHAQTTLWVVSCNQPMRPPEWSGLICGTTQHTWCMSFSCIEVYLWAVSVYMAKRSLWNSMSAISNYGQNERIEIWQSHRLQKEDNARNKKVSDMRPGFAKIIKIVHISSYFKCLKFDLHSAGNACCIDFAHTRLSAWLHSPSQCHSPNCTTA